MDPSVLARQKASWRVRDVGTDMGQAAAILLARTKQAAP